MLVETPARPRSWSSPLHATCLDSASDRPYPRAAADATDETRREWPAVYDDFRSAKSPIAASAASNCVAEQRVRITTEAFGNLRIVGCARMPPHGRNSSRGSAQPVHQGAVVCDVNHVYRRHDRFAF